MFLRLFLFSAFCNLDEVPVSHTQTDFELFNGFCGPKQVPLIFALLFPNNTQAEYDSVMTDRSHGVCPRRFSCG